MLSTAHFHHSTTFLVENIEKTLDSRNPRVLIAYPNLIKHKRQSVPAILPAFRAEHGVSAENIEPLDWKRAEDRLGGDDGGAEEDDVRMLLAEVMHVGVEGNAERLRRQRVIGPGIRQQGVALADESLSEELAEISESDYGDFQLGRLD
nr:hypothetical protein PanWU01x14_332130 [Ipomoea batatas]